MAIESINEKVEVTVSKFGNEYKIPRFQRSYVWKAKNIISLLDSIMKGYPIGGVITWNTDDSDKIIDGQQRVTSLYNSYNGIKQAENIHVNLIALDAYYSNNDNKQDVFLSIKNPSSSRILPLTDILNDNVPDIISRVDYRNIVKLKNSLDNYQLNITRVTGSAEDVVEMFTRINSKGKGLSVIDIMSAKCYGVVPLRSKLMLLQDDMSTNLIKSNSCDALRVLVDKGVKPNNSSIFDLKVDVISKRIDDVIEAFEQADEFSKKFSNPTKVLLSVAARHFLACGYEDDAAFLEICEEINEDHENMSRHAVALMDQYFKEVDNINGL